LGRLPISLWKEYDPAYSVRMTTKTNMLVVGKVSELAPAYGHMQRPRSLPLLFEMDETLANADPDIG